jgi:hypothetical protein
VIVFQIPSDAAVQWVHMNPSIYVTPNLFFDAAGTYGAALTDATPPDRH